MNARLSQYAKGVKNDGMKDAQDTARQLRETCSGYLRTRDPSAEGYYC
jgi:hypothetical protein